MEYRVLTWEYNGEAQWDSTCYEMICRLENNLPSGKYLIRYGPDEEIAKYSGKIPINEKSFEWDSKDQGIYYDGELRVPGGFLSEEVTVRDATLEEIQLLH